MDCKFHAAVLVAVHDEYFSVRGADGGPIAHYRSGRFCLVLNPLMALLSAGLVMLRRFYGLTRGTRAKSRQMKVIFLASVTTLAMTSGLLADGGAWMTGIPSTGSASASNKDHRTSVTIESQTLKIDLHSEYADVEVHYSMRNTGPKVQQEFFFPVERWGGEHDFKVDDLEHYQISVDSKELKWINVAAPSDENSHVIVGKDEVWEADVPVIKSWKKSIIPFERGQIREITIRYESRYCKTQSPDVVPYRTSDAVFAYSLSPAATWNGPIGKGKIDINILHPEPEDVSIVKPANRFRKTSDTHYEWSFERLKPSLADNIRIIAHSKYDMYSDYVVRGDQYFSDHVDYDAIASSTLAPQGKHHYDVVNIKGHSREGSPWCEGVEGDGVGESITLNVKPPLPLYGILILPGYWQGPWMKTKWFQNNRVAVLEITLNDEHTFTETIPDEFPDEVVEESYLIRVRDYMKAVNKIKLVIKGVYRGTQFRDTCISQVTLRTLSQKREIVPAR
jgi:hypothetical protein